MKKIAGITLLFCSILCLCTGVCPAQVTKHLVYCPYPQINQVVSPIARDYDVLVTGLYDDAIASIKSLNPDMKVLAYIDALGVYSCDIEWSTVTAHEDWFVHDSMGHRLVSMYHDWYLMDAGSAGWRAYFGDLCRRSLAAHPQADGIFADDVVGLDYQWRYDTLRAQIDNEKCFVGGDGVTITPEFPVWTGPYGPYITNNIIVSTAAYAAGMTKYAVTSFADHSITLQNALTPGATVYVTYGARNYDEPAYAGVDGYLLPPQSKVTSAFDDVSGFITAVKTEMGSRELVINTAGHDDEFIALADGMMDEAYVHFGGWSDTFFFNVPNWKLRVDKLAKNAAAGKVYMAHCGTSGDSGDSAHPTAAYTANIKKIMLYSLCSYMLGEGERSTFNFTNPGETLSCYPEWNADLGKPAGPYYPVEDPSYITGAGEPVVNLLHNPSFELGMSSWTKGVASGSIDVAVDNSVYRSGNASIRVTGTVGGDNTGGPFQYLPELKPNTTYTLSAWVKSSNVDSREFSGGTLLFYGGGSEDSSVAVPEGTHDWTPVSGTVVTGASTAGAYIAAQLRYGDGTIWFDDIAVREGIGPAYARDYEKGKVLVSPGGSGCRIKFDAPYLTFDNHEVTAIDMGPHDGAILFKKTVPSVSTTTTPADPATPSTATVSVPAEIVPRVLTPNGDGRNDRMLIRYSRSDSDEVRMQVYDMQGGIVCERTLSGSAGEEFRSDGAYGFLWDGKGFDHGSLQQGPYVMVVIINKKVVLKRNIVILR